MQSLFLIVGLGNPGAEYAKTRHNAGFMLADQLADRWKATWNMEKKFESLLSRVTVGQNQVLLSKPQTYMNASGEAVGPLVKYFRIPTNRLLIAVDDADLPLGEIRLRARGSSGGHHGIESIEKHIGTREFARLRIGIGRKAEDNRNIVNYVLGQFSSSETQLIDKVLKLASDQVECWINEGIEKAMNRFNRVIKPE